jgi:hypothetical protein
LAIGTISLIALNQYMVGNDYSVNTANENNPDERFLSMDLDKQTIAQLSLE